MYYVLSAVKELQMSKKEIYNLKLKNLMDLVAVSAVSKQVNDFIDEEDGEVLIYRYDVNEDGTPDLANIESDEEFELVAQAFDELQDEWEEEFAEEDEE